MVVGINNPNRGLSQVLLHDNQVARRKIQDKSKEVHATCHEVKERGKRKKGKKVMT
jgi:hypothetical protein